MTDALHRSWLIWHASLALYLLLLGAAHVASTARVTVLTLQPHVETQLNVFSVLGHDIYMDLEFRRSASKGDDDSFRSKDLGSTRQRVNGREVILPGQAIVLEVAIDDGLPLRLSATPANRSNQFVVARSLRADGIVPATLSPDEEDGFSKLVARPGLNRIVIRVVYVGAALRGEAVELIAQPPIRAGVSQPGYGMVVFIYLLLPVAMLVFITWSVALFILGAHDRQGRGPA